MTPIAIVNTTGFCYSVFHTRDLGFAHEGLVFMLFKEGDSTNSGVLTSVLEYIFFGTKSSGLCKHWSSDGEGSWQSGAEGRPQDHCKCSSLQSCSRERFPVQVSQLRTGRGGFPHQSCPGSACSPLLQGSIIALLRLLGWGA